MCLYTDQEAPEDLTGMVAYKGYRIIDGTLVTSIRKSVVDSMVQIAEGPMEIDVQPDGIYAISSGYIHAILDLRTARKFYDLIIKGKMVGKGWIDKVTGEVCAEGFELDEIVYERGDE